MIPISYLLWFQGLYFAVSVDLPFRNSNLLEMPRGYHVVSCHFLMSSISTLTGKYVTITLTTRHNQHSSHQSLYTDGHSNSFPRNCGSFHVKNHCYLHDRMQKIGHSTWRHHCLPQSWGALRTTRFGLPWMFDKGLDMKRIQDRVRRDMTLEL